MFRVVRWADEIPNKKKKMFFLEDRNFDDFSYKTSFYLYYRNKRGEVIPIGLVKILDIDKKHSKLDKNFVKLDNQRYCSLGQSREYYIKLKELGRDKYSQVLSGLNDYSLYPNENFYNLKGFRSSLLRDSIAYKIIDEGKKIIENTSNKRNPKNINYNSTLIGDLYETEIEIDYQKEGIIPYRVFAVVGKNGAGKTRMLENLMNDLVNEKFENFNNKEIKYDKIIHFTYGDVYEKIKTRDKKILSIKFINQIDNDDLSTLKEKEREGYLESFLESFFPRLRVKEILNGVEGLENLSSGERMTINFILKLIQNIQEFSLVIIDEIENHLHPNYLGMIITSLYQILRDYDSHAIISTHSPIVIQQIPSKNVSIIKKQEGYSITMQPDFETFGENLSEISDKVFDINSEEMFYKKFMIDNKRDLSLETNFLKGLSFNAKMYYESQRGKTNEE